MKPHLKRWLRPCKAMTFNTTCIKMCNIFYGRWFLLILLKTFSKLISDKVRKYDIHLENCLKQELIKHTFKPTQLRKQPLPTAFIINSMQDCICQPSRTKTLESRHWTAASDRWMRTVWQLSITSVSLTVNNECWTCRSVMGVVCLGP